jgi:hypothetical protein
MKSKNFLLIIVSSLACASAVAQTNYPNGLFSTSQMRIDSVRTPHGLDWYLKSREAQAILGSIAAYMGVNPKYVVLATEAIPTASQNGEETSYRLPVAPGYTFCAARIGVRSLAPAGGSRASVINAGSDNSSVGIYTWTPIQGIGGGKSWVEADVQVTGIRPEFLTEFRQKGVCKEPSQEMLKCRGNPCPGVEWGRLQDTGSSTSDLTKGF